MDDLISRQAAIEAIERNAYRHTYLDQIINIISNLPSAEVTLCHLDSPCEYQNADIAMPSAQQWIPVSERLPDGQTEVIVSCCDDSGDSKYNYTSCGWMTRDGEYWIVDNEINYYVNAWMPLPKPWRGDEDE